MVDHRPRCATISPAGAWTLLPAPPRHRWCGRQHRQIPRLHLRVRLQPRFHPSPQHPTWPLPRSLPQRPPARAGRQTL